MENLLDEEVRQEVRETFAQLQHPVQVLYFGSQAGCDYCDETLQLLEEVTGLSSKLALAVYDLEADAALASQYRVDKAPGIVIAGKEGERIIDYGIRLAGIPSGHEFSTLIYDIVLVSSRDSGLNPKTRQALAELKKPLHLQVFVTPT